MIRIMPPVSETIGPSTFRRMIHARSREPGRFCKLMGTDAIGLDVASPNPKVDASTMTVGPVVISTPAVDRHGDLLIPDGMRIDAYRENPVVFWEHGFSPEADGSMPIAVSEDADGNFRVEVTEQGVEAYCRFHGKTRLSEQVFALINAGVVKATSVRAEPIATRFIRDADDEYFVMDEWEMPEWSWGAIGVNRETLLKTVRDGRIDGKPLAAPLLKSFTPLVPAKSARGIGMPKPKNKAAEGLTTDDAPDKDQEVKTDVEEDEEVATKAEGDEESSGDQPADSGTEQPADDETTKADDGEAGAEGEDEELKVAKYGAQVLAALHTQVKELVTNLDAAMGPLENEEVKTASGELIEQLGEKLREIEGLYASTYSDQPPLESPPEEEQQAPDEEAMKSFLGSGRLKLARLTGYAQRLKTIASAKNLTPVQRRLIEEHIRGLGKLESEAKAHTKSAIEQAFDELKQQYAELQEQVRQVVPYRRSG